MFVDISQHDLIINSATINYVKVVSQTDQYHDNHIMIKFNGGDSLELPPEISLDEFAQWLEFDDE